MKNSTQPAINVTKIIFIIFSIIICCLLATTVYAGYVTTNGKVYADSGISYTQNNYDRYGSSGSYSHPLNNIVRQGYGSTHSNNAGIRGSTYVSNGYGTGTGRSGLSNDYVRNGYGTSSPRSGLSYNSVAYARDYCSGYCDDSTTGTGYKVYRTPVKHDVLEKYYNYKVKVYKYNNNDYYY